MSPVGPVQQALTEQGVRYLFGYFVDIDGVPKSKAVPIAHFDDFAKGSELYTVGALEGLGPLGPNEDECVGIPELSALTVLPWDPRYAAAPANLSFHGEPYSHDCRMLLERQVLAAAELGVTANMGVEPELYVLRQEGDSWVPWIDDDVINAPTRGYDMETTILADRFIEPMIDHMTTLGWDVYSFDHEGGDGQYEFDFGYTDVVSMADRMVLFRLMAKHVARSLGCVASFMPKPTQTAFGSGAHLNLSLADATTGRNLFEAEDGDYSALAYSFTAGVLAHAEACTAVLAPTVNSYKRLLPRGLMQEISWAPVFRGYGHNNRTLMLRLPMNRRCLEVRVADSAANIYLASALVLAAGLDGIRRNLQPGEPIEVDTYSMSEAELERAGIRRLPSTLGDALMEFSRSELAKDALGELHATFHREKSAEWLEYNTVVGEWERERYLRRL